MTTKAAQGSQKRARKKRAASAATKTARGASARTRKSTSVNSASGGLRSLTRDRLSGLKNPLSGQGKSKTPMEAEVSARALALFQRGLREALAILGAVVAILMLLSLMTFHVSDPSWSHTGGIGQVRNAGGILGAWFADISMFLLGYVAYVLPLAIGVMGWNAFRESRSVTEPLSLIHI